MTESSIGGGNGRASATEFAGVVVVPLTGPRVGIDESVAVNPDGRVPAVVRPLRRTQLARPAVSSGGVESVVTSSSPLGLIGLEIPVRTVDGRWTLFTKPGRAITAAAGFSQNEAGTGEGSGEVHPEAIPGTIEHASLAGTLHAINPWMSREERLSVAVENRSNTNLIPEEDHWNAYLAAFSEGFMFAELGTQFDELPSRLQLLYVEGVEKVAQWVDFSARIAQEHAMMAARIAEERDRRIAEASGGQSGVVVILPPTRAELYVAES